MSEADSVSYEPFDQVDFLESCERRIGYIFEDRQYLRGALTHASGANDRLSSNERLEFLGDAILGLTICEELFKTFPSLLEGELTKIKSVVVSRRTCAKISRALKMDDFLKIGKGMSNSESIPLSLFADVLEALVAAIYLDGGLDAAKRFILPHFRKEIDLVAGGHQSQNYKSTLQQVAQKDHGGPPTYHLLLQYGPDHAKYFCIQAQVGNEKYSAAWGRNKKDAEQRAAANALAEMEKLETPFPSDVYDPRQASAVETPYLE